MEVELAHLPVAGSTALRRCLVKSSHPSPLKAWPLDLGHGSGGVADTICYIYIYIYMYLSLSLSLSVCLCLSLSVCLYIWYNIYI